jgi:Na+-transporting NADH:ubiquinone oxidoreductase subunit B
VKPLRDLLDKIEPHVQKGARFEKLYSSYEAIDTFLFTPSDRTHTGPHVRDVLDTKRLMVMVVFALIPCIIMAMFNTGYQIHRVVEQGGTVLDNWQSAVYALSGLPLTTSSIIGSMVHGALYFVPVLIVATSRCSSPRCAAIR